MKELLKKSANKLGYKISKVSETLDPVIDKDNLFLEIFEQCKPYTMTSRERMYALYNAVKYIVKSNIKGDFVECGVWKGGSTMLIALTLIKLGVKNRKIYLYDTYEGMSQPTEADIGMSKDNLGVDTKDYWKDRENEGTNDWCLAQLDEVKNNMTLTNYPKENIFYIKGKVEDTIPKSIPENISLLRLDTDWYESTKHELNHLYPLVSKNGVLIIDDYGSWAGARKAVDEYFENIPMLLNRIDHTGRIGLKTT